jgi:hypothetical protein
MSSLLPACIQAQSASRAFHISETDVQEGDTIITTGLVLWRCCDPLAMRLINLGAADRLQLVVMSTGTQAASAAAGRA